MFFLEYFGPNFVSPVVVNDSTGLICILNRLDDHNTTRIRRYVFLIKAAIPNVQHNIHHSIYQPTCQVLFASAVAKIRPGCAHIILIILKVVDLW